MRKIVLFVSVAVFCIRSMAQISTLGDAFEQKTRYEVLNIAQFIDRYNSKLMVRDDSNKVMNRRYNLAYLFDISDTALMHSDAVHDLLNRYLIDSAHAKITYLDSNWESIAHTTFKLGKGPVKINIVLGIYPDQYGYKWLIKRVEYKEAPVQYCHDATRKINPVNNEVDFSELWKAFTWNRDVTCFAKDTNTDMTSIFYYQVQHKLIDFQSIDSIEYTFNTGFGYRLLVKNFNRPSANSGWLVYKMEQISKH